MSSVLLNIILLIFILLFVIFGRRSYELNDGLYIMIFSLVVIVILSDNDNPWVITFTIIIILVNGLTHHFFKRHIDITKRM